MKKILLSLAAAVVALGASAASLTPEQALARVNTGAMKAPGVNGSVLQLVESGEYEGLPTYYIYSSNDNALIISADDVAVPVLAVLDHPVTASTPMPPQLQWWLEGYGKEIAWAVANDYSVVRPMSRPDLSPVTPKKGMKLKTKDARNDNVEYASYTAIPAMVKTQWNQDAPFNDLCPSSNKGTAYTGCVATAMAQVMKFHNYPPKGKGTVSVTFNNNTYTMNLTNTSFDWDNMLDVYTSSATATQKTAVATLMKACGYSVDMDYGLDASGAQSSDVVAALTDCFSYDKAVNYQLRDYFDPDVWAEKVYNELASGRVVYYAGRGSDGGHAFVCDGYQDEKFHFNWGWGGYYDGFFKLTSLVPEGQGAGGNSDGFTLNQGAIFGIQRPVSGSVKANGWIAVYPGQMSPTCSGRTVTISVTGGGFYNLSGSDFSGSIGFSLTPQDGGETKYYTAWSNQSFGNNRGFTSLPCAIPASVADGTYILRPACKALTSSEWENILVKWTDPDQVVVTISGNKVTATLQGGHDVPQEPAAKLAFSNASTSTGFYCGQEFKFSVTITNSGNLDYSKQLAAVIVDSDGYIRSTINYQQVDLPMGESKNFNFTGTIESDLTSGTYYLYIVDSDLKGVQGYNIPLNGTVEAPDYEITLTVNPEPLEVGASASVQVEVVNNGEKALNEQWTLELGTVSDNKFTTKHVFGPKTINNASKRTKTYKYTSILPAQLPDGDYFLALWNANDEPVFAYNIKVNGTSGIFDIDIDSADAPVEYFDLQGRRVANPSAGIYIRRSGFKVDKILVK